MFYTVKEIFYTLQGEGARTGRTSVFCRFSGCNLWSGREQDRGKAVCKFCDTDFVGTNGPGGGKFSSANDLAMAIADKWPICSAKAHPYVVCTGGEPLLQLDVNLVEALHEVGFEVAVETNGTCEAPEGIDWICVSPKAGSELLLRKGNELKLVFPQRGIAPEDFGDLMFDHFYLQPMDGPNLKENTRKAVDYCLSNPQWQLSQQTHKILGIP